MKVAAIIPAAGAGVRMQHKTPKPYLMLAGQPILAHTLSCFEAAPEVHEVTLVVHPKDLDRCQEKVIAPFAFKKVLRLVPGGKERQDSVYNALKVLQKDEDVDIILVHDGVRPFINRDHIRRVIQAARKHGAAILGWPAQDTLKKISPNGEVVKTLDRANVWQIQTPQAFQVHLLWRAFLEAYSRNFYGTDEASLMEEIDQTVVVVKGSPLNLKITTREDLQIAEAILAVKKTMGEDQTPLSRGPEKDA